ncbi:toll/interleukin-1 receptor domain-containing protein [Treponema sp.]|uniref:toll/interleukin-1 receptor domain-containing protein n=1 Tax=Treponema sp. TaxID=166 RepID=UPI00298EAAC3|nr:toll/interleukin-1 receptor domain-containing protein [Treponema sp.]MCQ2240245.1 toll/interleukin-1 receptor domain-containing protein [Treponema sp.]
MSKTYFTESELKKNIVLFSVRDSRYSERLLNESSSLKSHYDFFLSHSSADFELIQGLYKKLKDMGFSAFLDRVDAKGVSINDMADKLKKAMDNSNYILYSHTHNSIDSKWVPWELGYFDCKNNASNILVMPILNNQGKALYDGQEYLNQYKEISVEDLNKIKSIKLEERIKHRDEILKSLWS